VGQRPTAGRHKLTEQFGFGALEDLNVNAFGDELFRKLGHETGQAFHFLGTFDATVGRQQHTQAGEQFQGIDTWL
jgi:hypothetical protein